MLRDTFKCKLRIKQSSLSGEAGREGERSKNKFRGQKRKRKKENWFDLGSKRRWSGIDWNLSNKFEIHDTCNSREYSLENIISKVGFNFIHLFVHLFSFFLFFLNYSTWAEVVSRVPAIKSWHGVACEINRVSPRSVASSQGVRVTSDHEETSS